jgi:hypothetical protein
MMDPKHIAKLEKMPTRQIMHYMQRARECRNDFYSLSGYSYGEPFYTIEEMKKVLATREHVPNKKEAKALRRERAKRGV